MIFERDGKKYRISFGHRVFEGKGQLTHTVRGEQWVRAETKCFLVELPPNSKDGIVQMPVNLAEGVAHCYVPDQFNKEEGRVRALRNALRQIWPLNRRMWGVAFTAYNAQRRLPKKKVA